LQYVLDKAIDLYKINKLTSKEKQELFELIVTTGYSGPFHAYRMLMECKNLITSEQRSLLIKILMRNETVAAKYFLKGDITKEERKQLFSTIITNLYATTKILNDCDNDGKRKFSLSAKEIALIIKNFKAINKYKKEDKSWHSDVADSVLFYIKNGYQNKNNLQDKLFQVIFGNIDFLNTVIFTMRKNYFNDKQRKAIYFKYSKEMLKKNKNYLGEIVWYCSYFYDLINYEEKELLVKKIIMENNIYMANYYVDKNNNLPNKIDFPPNLIEKLNSLLIMWKLTKD